MIYFDYNATTPLCDEARDAMLPYLGRHFGNPSSVHTAGREARAAIDDARDKVSSLLHVKPNEIIFTSGGTESCNLAVLGLAKCSSSPGGHVISNKAEHHAVLNAFEYLEGRENFEVTWLDVSQDGVVDLEQLARAIRPETRLVSIMAANNETGTLQPIAEIGKLCRERDIIFHTDAAQAVGKISLSVREQNIDLLSICGHKLYAPKGVGALYVRSGINLAAQIDGGGHEHGMRSGTLNVPGIVGLGKACDICREGMPQESARISALRNRLRDKILDSLDGVSLNGSTDHRLPGNLNMSFAGVQGEELLTALDDIAVSSGAACTSAHIEPSYVLKALGISDELAQASLRFGIGRFNTEAEVDYVAGRVIETLKQLRELG